MSYGAPTIAATLLSHDAHDLRNHIATMRSIVGLIEDEEVANALDQASRALQLAVERAVVSARVDLGVRPDIVPLTLTELLRLAARRAHREGALVEVPDPASLELLVEVPGPWAERLLADLLHHGGAAPSCVARESGANAVLALELARPVESPLSEAMITLADECGGSLQLAQGEAVLHLPLARAVIVE